ncbi:hypothetical protein SESBI_05417 [Sesbania bispinosa]|nr:hypothetical protein SESBI_05417 [Sesbania bispinosa]
MGCSSVPAPLSLGPNSFVNWFHHALEETVFCIIKRGKESKISGLAPNEEVEGSVEELAALIEGGRVRAIGEPDVGFGAEERAPGCIVAEEFEAERAEDGGVEGVEGVRERGEAHLGVGEVKDEVLALVANVVVLEAEEEGEPVEEVHGAGVPSWGRGRTEVTDEAESGGGGAYFREAEGRVVGGVEGVMEGDDVVGLDVVVAMSDRHVIGVGNRECSTREDCAAF